MLRAIIIDDEEDARFLLRNHLEKYFKDRVEVVAEGNDVDTGLNAIQAHTADVVFLDIKMKKGTGFDLLQKLSEVPFEVIFVTAYDSYAVQAFQLAAFGYLLKPVKMEELRKVVERLEERQQDDGNARLKVLIDQYSSGGGMVKKIVISNMEGFQVVDISDIIRLEADRNYTHFFLKDGKKLMVSKTIGEYEGLLYEHGFFRVHQSHIVNLQHVKNYFRANGGKVQMSDGSELYISRNKKAAFMKKFI